MRPPSRTRSGDGALNAPTTNHQSLITNHFYPAAPNAISPARDGHRSEITHPPQFGFLAVQV